MDLIELLTPALAEVRTYQYFGRTYYLGCDVMEMLGLSNMTQAMGRSLTPPKVSRRNWEIQLIPAVNSKRGVYLFTYEGIEELVKNNNNADCKELRRRMTQ